MADANDAQQALNRANDIAAQIALTALIKVLIGEVFFHPDRDRFRRRLAMIEDGAVSTIDRDGLFPGADTFTSDHIRATASGFISRTLAGIVHPSDTPGNDAP